MRALVLDSGEETGCQFIQFGEAAVLVDRPTGRVWWSWNDFAHRGRHREDRWLTRQLRRLGVASLGEAELIEDGYCVASGRFEVAE